MGVKNLGLINLPTSTLHPALYNLASEEMNMPVLCQDLHYCELHDQIFPLTLCGKTVLLSLKFRFIKWVYISGKKSGLNCKIFY